ncbi:MAG: plasmid partitioning protein RepB [Ahrensia sp.]
MTSRKDSLRSMFGGTDPKPDTQSDAPMATAPRRPAPTGALKTMGLSLDAISQAAPAALPGEQVVEIDTALIDASPLTDRLDFGGADFEELKVSLAAHGQQVPVLLRPHPTLKGRYQAAYGHRRIRALSALGKPVRAVVKALSDEALVIAQGKENAERRDLSFIERALFAQAMIDHGFSRATAQAALSAHKADMTRYFQVMDVVPAQLVRAIGPAQKVGRPRWMALGALLGSVRNADAKLAEMIHGERFQKADSDLRFQMVLDRLSKKKPKAPPKQVLAHDDGQPFGAMVIDEAKGKATITLDLAAAPDLIERLKEALPAMAVQARRQDS